MKRSTLVFPILIAFLISSCQSDSGTNEAPPLVDGSIEDFKALGVIPTNLGPGVDLYFYQDKHYVWIAYDYPDGSWGTLDLKLKTEELDGPLNLHVSAQVGEWPLDNPELAPKNPESNYWWNTNGWTANAVWTNGMDRSGDVPRYRFKNAKARELQLSKKRFGRGEWKLTMEIRAIAQANGERSTITFPQDGSEHILEVF